MLLQSPRASVEQSPRSAGRVAGAGSGRASPLGIAAGRVGSGGVDFAYYNRIMAENPRYDDRGDADSDNEEENEEEDYGENPLHGINSREYEEGLEGDDPMRI